MSSSELGVEPIILEPAAPPEENVAHEAYALKIWGSQKRALHFLFWIGICILPGRCNFGHAWEAIQTSENSFTTECNFKKKSGVDVGADANRENAGRFCKTEKMSWRSVAGSLMTMSGWSNRI